MNRTYEEVVQEVDNITDGLNYPIDGGIKKIVIALRLLDFPTTGSCEGHLKRGLYPFVEIYAPEQDEKNWEKANLFERKRLEKLLHGFYAEKDIKPIFKFENIGIFGGFRLVNNIKPSKKKLTKSLIYGYRSKFDEFAEFLLLNTK